MSSLQSLILAASRRSRCSFVATESNGGVLSDTHGLCGKWLLPNRQTLSFGALLLTDPADVPSIPGVCTAALLYRHRNTKLLLYLPLFHLLMLNLPARLIQRVVL